jgi:S-DNA-T family DNA segregation ATPase FtsK/SpoIIIE
VNLIIEFYSDQEPQYSRELAQLGSGSAKGGRAESRRCELGTRCTNRRSKLWFARDEGAFRCCSVAWGSGMGGRHGWSITWRRTDRRDYNGSQAREVLYTLEQWQAMVRGESPDDFD